MVASPGLALAMSWLMACQSWPLSLFFQLQPGPGDDRHQLLLHGIEPFGGNGGGRHGDGGIAFGEFVVRRGRGRVDAMHGYSSM